MFGSDIMVMDALEYADKDKVYEMIRQKGSITTKVGSLNPYYFFFNSSADELEKEGKVIGKQSFFGGKVTWTLTNPVANLKNARLNKLKKLKWK